MRTAALLLAAVATAAAVGPPRDEVPRGVIALCGGDLVLSHDENDPKGPVLAKRVEEVFVRTGRMLLVFVRGKTIRTTPEHPFRVVNRAEWLPAGALRAGDVLVGLDGGLTEVEGIEDTGRHETAYNLRVEDFHTYFVGCQDWGFSVWAHNADGACGNGESKSSERELRNISFKMLRELVTRLINLENQGRKEHNQLPDVHPKTIREAVDLAWEGKHQLAREKLHGKVSVDAWGQLEVPYRVLWDHAEKLLYVAGAGSNGKALSRIRPGADPALIESYRDALIRQFGEEQQHHVFTNKNEILIHGAYDSPYTPMFERIVGGLSSLESPQGNWLNRNGALSLDVPVNIIPVRGHRGPHAQYDAMVFEFMRQNLAGQSRQTGGYDATFWRAFTYVKQETVRVWSPMNKAVTGE